MAQLPAMAYGQVARMFYDELPKVMQEDELLLKRRIQERVERMKLDGPQVLKILVDACQPGAKSLDENETFVELFKDTEQLFANAITATRSAQVFAQTMFKKVVLSSCICEEDRRVIQAYWDPYRDPAYDSAFLTDELWCIQCGHPQLLTYDSKIGCPGEGTKAFHGYQVCPQGWIKLAVKTKRAPSEWLEWHKAYHGTCLRNVDLILEQGLKIPEKAVHGAAGAGGKMVIYASPCVEYSAHFLYTGQSTVCQHSLEQVREIEGDSKSWVQYVFEVRVRPGSYRVQGNTLHETLWPETTLEFDLMCNSKSLEWIIEKEEDVEITGVLIRQLPKAPADWNKERIARMKQHVEWKDGCATRKRDHGKDPDSKVAPREGKWQWNASTTTLSRADDQDWRDYGQDISQAIEGAYLAYQRFCFIGDLGGNPYVIDFQSWCNAGGEGPIQLRADSGNQEGWRQRAIRRVPKES
ncbi:unnamed protein product [Effrenium voratum]|uniref:WWE domain-containing protein n=1 Tax=Effrenium voratum TaxID=2562239 RepID=A0AA36J5P3_9DINO|nr:unnamed protein product [Effrenium voratum]CAJ1421481.1 unnamed protein product [Effrenium voratum]